MKLKKLFLVSAIVLLVSACSQIAPPSISSPKSLGELITDLKNISKNYDIIEVDINEKDELTSDFGFVLLTLMKDGKNYSQTLYYNYGIAHDDPKERKSSFDKGNPQSVNVEDIEKRQNEVEKYLENAKSQINENLEGYSFKSIKSIKFYLNDNGNFETELRINIIEDGNSERRESGRTVIDYYTITFLADSDGNVVYKE
ncbi:MAG: hypothetical protein LBE11_07455 [Prevotellaceae bacterium]|jgi:hypothetical protein|nr:hypothetical protein [Prevotellaceae bacterium]